MPRTQIHRLSRPLTVTLTGSSLSVTVITTAYVTQTKPCGTQRVAVTAGQDTGMQIIQKIGSVHIPCAATLFPSKTSLVASCWSRSYRLGGTARYVRVTAHQSAESESAGVTATSATVRQLRPALPGPTDGRQVGLQGALPPPAPPRLGSPCSIHRAEIPPCGLILS
jgi:hypothetical protein